MGIDYLESLGKGSDEYNLAREVVDRIIRQRDIRESDLFMKGEINVHVRTSRNLAVYVMDFLGLTEGHLRSIFEDKNLTLLSGAKLEIENDRQLGLAAEVLSN